MYRSVSLFLCQITALSWRSSTHCFQYAVFFEGGGGPYVQGREGKRRTGCNNPLSRPLLLLSSTPLMLKIKKWGVLCACDCQFCLLVRLINQEKGESVSMHTVASHMAYREAFIFFLFVSFQCLKMF